MNKNPLRYRGYVYDSETGFYYLQSRYYDPVTCRFINADVYCSTGQGITGNNMFAYCGNNPVMYYDPTGTKIFECCPYGDCYDCKKKRTSVFIEAMPDEVPVSLTNSTNTSFSLANYVQKVHITTPTVTVGDNFLIGNIGFSSTVTKQNKELGLVHVTSDIGNDAISFSAGVNIVDWLGMDIGVSSEANSFISAQVTPWVHGEVSVGFDKIGGVIGFDLGDTSYDFEINVNLVAAMMFVVPQVSAFSGQLSGALI